MKIFHITSFPPLKDKDPIVKKRPKNEMAANKGVKDLMVLGALAAAAAGGYYYYEKEKDHKKEPLPETKNEPQHKPDNSQRQGKSEEKPVDQKTVSSPGTKAETKK